MKWGDIIKMDFVCGNCKCVFNRNAVNKYHFDYGDEAYICPICRGILIDVENENDLMEALNMYQDVDAMWDEHLNNLINKHCSDPKSVCKCVECSDDIFAGYDCYYINGEYYCEDCVNGFKVTLDNDSGEDYWED